MVNFRGALKGLGTGLAYLGQQGIEEQQRVAADARLLAREQAFARFQSGIRTEEAEAALDRGVTEAKVMTPHRVALEEETLTVREPFRAAEAQRTEQANIRQEGRQNQEWTRRNQVEFNTWRRRHGIEEDTARSRELWRREEGLDPSSAPQRYLENGETGTYTAIYRDGTTEDTGVVFVNENEDTGEQAPRRPGAARPRSRERLSARGNIARPRTPAEVERLPRGTRYMSPDGRMFTRN